MKTFYLLFAAVSACATANAPVADDPPVHGQTPGHTCQGDNLQQFVGQERTDALEAQILQVSKAAIVRWAPHGTAVTMDFRADRVTVFLDESNRVKRIACG
jgi:hypothetical protein